MIALYRAAAATLVAGLAVLYSYRAADAASVAPLSPEQVLANSDMVALVRIESASTRWSGPDEAMIATDYRVRLESVLWDPGSLYGVKRDGDSLVLSFAGGTIGQKTVWVPGVPTFGVGERAFFFLSRSDKGAVSPLTGMVAGVNRIAEGRGRGEVLGATSGVALTSTFFSAAQDRPQGFTVAEFADEIRRAMPLAKADPALIFRDDVPEGDRKVPETPPMGAVMRAEGAGHVRPPAAVDVERDPLIPFKPPVIDNPGPETAEHDFDVRPAVDPDRGIERYTYLWAAPNAPSVFNIPPQYYGASNWGLNFEYSCSDWNRYATLFRKYVTSDNTFGHQGRNDYAFTTPATFQTVYGFALGGTTLGIAVMYNWWGNLIGNGQKIYESDVILNSTKSWTSDFKFAYNNPGTYYVRSTTIHELGHCFGREHQFTGQPTSTLNSVMNYTPSGALDAEYFLPFADDALSIRNRYPQNALTDLGVHLFRTSGVLNANGYIRIDWSTFPANVTAGNNFQVTSYAIENLGTNTAAVTVDWYLCPTQFSFTGAIYCSRSTYPNIPSNNVYNANATVKAPLGTPAGQYYIAADLPSDANNFNRTAWSNTKITVAAAPPPPPPPVANDHCWSASLLASGSTIPGTTAGSTPSPVITVCAGSVNANDVWYYVDAGCQANLTFRVCSTQAAFSPNLSVYRTIGTSLDCPLDANTMVACATSGSCTPPLPGCFSSACVSLANASGRYMVRVANATGNGTFTISYDAVNSGNASNDNCAGALVLTNGLPFNLCNSTPSGGGPTISCNGATIPVGNDLWYRWTAPSGGEAEFSTCGSTDTVLRVHQGSCAGAAIACSDDDCGVGSVVQFFAVGGTTYYLRVAGYSTSVGAGFISVAFTPATSCPGDFNLDGGVDTADLTILLGNFGRSAGPLQGDMDGNGFVNTADLVQFLVNFGYSCF